MNYALITGASSGIGYELAVQFAKNGHSVILVARNEEKLKQISDYLENTFKINTLIIPTDLSRPDACRNYKDALIKEIDSYIPLLGNKPITSFYIGGGTPTTMIGHGQDQITLTSKGAYWIHAFEDFFSISYINKLWGTAKNDPWPEEVVL